MGKAFAALGLLAIGLLTVPALTSSTPSPNGLQLDLEHHLIGWGSYGWPFPKPGPWHSPQPKPDHVDFAIEAPPVFGLYPGATKPMKVRVVNSGRHDLRITNLSGTLVRTSNRGCSPSASNVTVQQRQAAAITVPAHGRREAAWLSLYMPNTVVDPCAGATFTIQLRGTGTEVHR